MPSEIFDKIMIDFQEFLISQEKLTEVEALAAMVFIDHFLESMEITLVNEITEEKVMEYKEKYLSIKYAFGDNMVWSFYDFLGDWRKRR